MVMSICAKILEASAEYEMRTCRKPLYLVLGTNAFAALYCDLDKFESTRTLPFTAATSKFFGMSVVVVPGVAPNLLQVCGEPFFDFERGIRDEIRDEKRELKTL